MGENGDRLTTASEGRFLEYQGARRKKLRLGYAIAAGICGLGSGIVLFGGAMQLISARTAVPASDGVADFMLMGFIGTLFGGAAWYFASKMLKDRGEETK
jgi:hypothetical protein